jgi:cobalt-zinc-cadmium efflux system membrane fusion protein
MTSRTATVLRVSGLVVFVVVVLGVAAAAMPRVKAWLKAATEKPDSAAKNSQAGQLDAKDSNTLILRQAQADALGVKTDKVRKATQTRNLELPGSLAPDTDYLLPVRSRFPGEVMEIGHLRDQDKDGRTFERPIRNGDLVKKDDVLAVVYSKDLGLQKSALVDAVSKLRLDEETLQRLQGLYQEGSIPERSLREGQRNVESDRIALAGVERTLRAWRLTDKEIKDIYEEADRIARRIRKGEKDVDKEQAKDWARVVVQAPFDGTIVEKNLAFGAIIDTTTNLYMIADLHHLSAWANLYEEDLPAVKKLTLPFPWTIRLKADPDVKLPKCYATEIRPIIDPNQHAALVKGPVDNSRGRFVSGQFITATIGLPPDPDEVMIPTTALIEESGTDSIVFVQPDTDKYHYTLRQVAVVRRTRDWVFVRSALPETKGPGQKDKPDEAVKPLQPGEWVVVAGALEMRAALRDLQDTAQTAKK